MEQAVHNASAARIGEELAVVADEAATRAWNTRRDLPAPGASSQSDRAFALGNLLHHGACKLFVNVDDHFFNRLELVASFIRLEDRTRGRLIDSSKPSRRITSIKIPS